MGKKRREKLSLLFGLTNVKRCLCAALLSVAAFPGLLVLSFVEPEFAKEQMIPMAFFSAGSGAFAFLLYQVAKNKIKQYYEVVTWAYLIAFHLFFIYMAQANLLFYYAVVLLGAYMVLLPLERYVIMTVGELVCFAAIYVKGGAEELPVSTFLFLVGAHLFAFAVSRDLYNTKNKFIVEEKNFRRELLEAEYDPLTGLSNQQGLERRINEMWQASINHQEMVAAYVIDIDYLQSLNDRFGHTPGDECIRLVAGAIADAAGNGSLCGRIGGGEFVVFAKSKDVQELYNLAEHMRQNVERLRISRGTTEGTFVTVSIGMDVRCPAMSETSLQGLCGRADKALYQAKQDSRNCVRTTYMMREERRIKIG